MPTVVFTGRPKKWNMRGCLTTKTSKDAVIQEYMEDDQAMKTRFEEWMKQFGRTYKHEEEKARRFKILLPGLRM
jgi:uncharacterized Fe-S cluster-containing MiaB family protein